MAIKIAWTLEGTEKVQSDIDKTQKKFEDFGKSINDIGKQGDVGLGNVVSQLKDAGLNFDQASDKSLKLSGSFKILASSLKLMGVELGNVGALSRLLGAGGGVLAALGTVAAAVGIGKLEENLARMRGELTDAFGGTAKGQQAFSALQKSAQEFGSSVSDLVPGLVSFQTALANVNRTAAGFKALKAEDLPLRFRAPDVEQVTQAYDNFLKLLRAGRLTQDDAKKSADAFFATLAQGGAITSAALKNLPIETLKQLQDALGAGGLTRSQFFAAIDAGAISLDKFTVSLAKFGPEAQKAFDSKAVKTMGDELGRIAQALITEITPATSIFSSTFIAVLDGIVGRVRTVIGLVKQLGQALVDANARKQLEITGGVTTGPTIEQAFGKGFVGPLPSNEQLEQMRKAEESAKRLQGVFISSSNSLQNMGAAGIVAGNQIPQGLKKATDALNEFTAATSRLKQAQQAVQDLRGSRAFTDPFADFGVEQQNAEDRARRAAQEAFIDQQRAEQEAKAQGALPGFPQSELRFAELQKGAGQAGQGAGQTFVENFNTAIEQGDLGKGIETKFQDLQQVLGKEPPVIKITPIIDEEKAQQFDINTQIDEQQRTIDLNINADAAQQQAQTLWEQIKQIFSETIQLNISSGGGTGVLGFASGGAVHGPGSTTSDSIMALLSNREWVINAKAVDFYGSNLFAALNSMKLPRSLLSMPKFAEGGQVHTASTLNLILGGRSFTTTTSDETLNSLRRFAVHSQLASIGRKPGFVR